MKNLLRLALTLTLGPSAWVQAQWSESPLVLDPFTYVSSSELKSGDFNGDGQTDVLVFSPTNQLISWLDAAGGGVMEEHTVAVLWPSIYPPYTHFCEVSDVNSDGHLDVVTTHHEFSSETEIITWYENDGTGLNWTPHSQSTGVVFGDMKNVKMADLDRDGDRDLILTMTFLSLNPTDVLLYEATPNGFSFVTTLDSGPERTEPVLGDFDGDGNLDVGGLNRTGSLAMWARNQSVSGSWSFGPAIFPIPMDTVTLATDWDLDGDTDLVVGHSSSSIPSEILLVENDGTGNFLTPTPVFQSGPGTGPDISFRDLRTADLDGDGDEELVFLWTTEFFGTARYSYLVNEGGGAFNTRVDIRTYPAGHGSPVRFIADFDSDGDLDAIEQGGYIGQNPTLNWLRNDRTFGQAVTSCPGLVNSAGHLSHLEVVGSQTANVNRTTLAASQLPGGEFTLFLLGDSAFSGIVPFGSQGRFCLNGPLGRFNRLGELRKADSSGRALFAVNLNDVPTPTGSGVVTAGTTKVFQAWHRDTVAGSSTSNFTNAVELTFL